MNELALFAGAGGGILGGRLLGWETVAAIEIDPYCRSILLARQNDGTCTPFPIWDDVRTFDGKPWRGIVDVVSGGFPCQDISVAGKGAGIEGERSGLWKEMARIIGEVRPRFVFVENVATLLSRGLDVVLGDLCEMGFDAEWGIVSASDAGAPHLRERVWILAYSKSGESWIKAEWERRKNSCGGSEEASSWTGERGQMVADSSRILEGRKEQRAERKRTRAHGEPKDLLHADEERREQHQPSAEPNRPQFASRTAFAWWREDPADSEPQSGMGRVADGVASRVDRLKALGNGQVPGVAAIAWEILKSKIEV